MMKRIISLLSVFVIVCSMNGVADSRPVFVRDFGAVINDGKGDAAAIHRAAATCQPGDRLVFERGTYDLFEAIVISNQENLDMDGQGAQLLIRGFDRSRGGPTFSAIRVVSCRNVVVHDFSIDMDVSPNSAGTIVQINDRSFDVRVHAEFPVTGDEYIDHVMTFLPDGRPNGKNLDYYNLQEGIGVEKISDQVLRIDIDRVKDLSLGERVCLYHKVYGGVAILFDDVSDAVLRDVTVFAFPGMGFISTNRSKNVTLERYHVRRPEGSARLTSTNADGSKYIHTGGLLTIKDCTYEGMGDDAINIHSSFGAVASMDSSQASMTIVRIQRNRKVAVPRRYVLPGDELEFYDAKTLLPKGTARIKEREGERIVLDAIPQGVQAEDLFNNISMTPVVRISGVTVQRNRARGFLLQSQDVIVENCTISYPTGVGIFVTTDVNYWFESGPGRDVIIRNNTIIGANNRLCREGAITVKCGHDSGGVDFPAGVHRNITIANNLIRDTQGSGIFACSTDGIFISNNTIEHGSTDPVLPTGRYAIYLKNCKNGSVEQNRVFHGGEMFHEENCTDIRYDGEAD